jgi:hypothetical protein
VEVGVDERRSEYEMKDRRFLATWIGEGGRDGDVGDKEGDGIIF